MPGSAQPASIESVHHGSITSVRPTNTGTAECALSKGAPVLVPAFLAGYLSSGDEIQVPLASNQVGTEIHVRKNAASRLLRELYEAPIGYVTRPKEDKRKEFLSRLTCSPLDWGPGPFTSPAMPCATISMLPAGNANGAAN